MSQANVKKALSTVSGKRVITKLGTLTPAFFGSTILELHSDRIIEYTTAPIAARECHMLAPDIESAELITSGNPLFLVLGVLTLPMFGLGLIFLALYFFIKYRFLMVSSGNTVIAVGVKGGAERYRSFMFNVLKIANHHQSLKS